MKTSEIATGIITIGLSVLIGHPLTRARKTKEVLPARSGQTDSHMAFANDPDGVPVYALPDRNLITRLPYGTYIGVVASKPQDGWQKLVIGIKEGNIEKAFEVWALASQLHIPDGRRAGFDFLDNYGKDKSRTDIDYIAKYARKHG